VATAARRRAFAPVLARLSTATSWSTATSACRREARRSRSGAGRARLDRPVASAVMTGLGAIASILALVGATRSSDGRAPRLASLLDATLTACEAPLTHSVAGMRPSVASPAEQSYSRCAKRIEALASHENCIYSELMAVDEVADSLRRSVVKLFTVFKEPSYYKPWELDYQQTSGGSACIVEGNRILTNAHVVAHQMFVQALKPGDTKKYTARLLHVDHDTETALLTVDDPAFFAGTTAVTFGDLPTRNSRVTVYGFPVGGNELCVTAGVISRIEIKTYTHSQRDLLAMQTDAAINPGNSGGPVFMDGKLIGIAFQSYKQKDLEKAGYIVPISIIQHMFDDLDNGSIEGVPDLGILWQKIENDTLRAYLGLSPDQTGVRVSRVVHGSSADSELLVDDVILAIDGTPIASDGSISLRDHDRVQFEYLISRHQIGDTVTLSLIRHGSSLDVRLELRPYVSLVPPPRPDLSPSYLIFAGLVFTKLSYEYMHEWDWARKHHRYATFKYDDFPSPKRSEVVVIHQILAHEINLGYHLMREMTVERVNNVVIATMQDVVRALASPVGAFHVIETDHHGPRSESQRSDFHASYGTRIVLDAAQCERATAEILKQHSISNDRSADLR
jgi:S1-C subfamily serine protease